VQQHQRNCCTLVQNRQIPCASLSHIHSCVSTLAHQCKALAD
jgi:hypothetical protein